MNSYFLKTITSITALMLFLSGCAPQPIGMANDKVTKEQLKETLEQNKTQIEAAVNSETIGNMALKMGAETLQCAAGSTSINDHMDKFLAAGWLVITTDVSCPGASILLIRRIQTYLLAAKGAMEIAAASGEKDCVKISGSTYDLIYGHFVAMGLFWKYLGGQAIDIVGPVLMGAINGKNPTDVFSSQLALKQHELGPEFDGILKALTLTAQAMTSSDTTKAMSDKIDDALAVIHQVEKEKEVELKASGIEVPGEDSKCAIKD